MAKEQIRFNPGLILGNYHTYEGVEAAFVESNRLPLYDKNGQRQNAVWTISGSEGLFAIEFQWDAADYHNVLSVLHKQFQVSVFPKGGPTLRDFQKLYLVQNVQECLRSGRPIVKEAPSDTEEWIGQLTKWVKKNSKFAHKILTKAGTFYSTEQVCLVGFFPIL